MKMKPTKCPATKKKKEARKAEKEGRREREKYSAGTQVGGVGVSAYLSLIGRSRGGRLFEAGHLLTFSAFRMGAYSRWVLI